MNIINLTFFIVKEFLKRSDRKRRCFTVHVIIGAFPVDYNGNILTAVVFGCAGTFFYKLFRKSFFINIKYNAVNRFKFEHLVINIFNFNKTEPCRVRQAFPLIERSLYIIPAGFCRCKRMISVSHGENKSVLRRLRESVNSGNHTVRPVSVKKPAAQMPSVFHQIEIIKHFSF